MDAQYLRVMATVLASEGCAAMKVFGNLLTSQLARVSVLSCGDDNGTSQQ
jgi:hypothetical protein